MKVVYFRVFVARATQLSLLDTTNLTKPQLIEKAFNTGSDPLYFNMGERKFAYVVHKVAPPYIYASLAKQSQVKIQHSPEEDFETEAIETWPNVPLIINTDGDQQTGQSIAVELNTAIFDSPHVQIRRLVTELNRRVLREFGHEMAIHPITEKTDFWATVTQYAGQINSIEFEFSAPNLFGTNDSLNDELRDARDSFRMTKASVKVENSEGELNVPEDNNFVKEGVQYVTDGGGEYTIRLTGRRKVTSDDAVKSKVIEETELEIAATEAQTLKSFCDTLFSWLRR